MEISDGREKIKSQTKSFSAVSVSATQDAKAFEDSQDVFDAHAA